MLDQTASLGSGPVPSLLGSKRLLACSAMVSRSRTRACAVGMGGEEVGEAGVLADGAAAGFEELGKIFLKLCGGHLVEIGCSEVFHQAITFWPAGSFRQRLWCGVERLKRLGFAKEFAELEAGLVELGLAVAGGAFEHGGDLVVLEAFDVVEDEDHAVAGRKQRRRRARG